MTQEPGVGPELDIATVLDAIAARHPDTECLVFRDRRLTWSEVSAHTDRLAGYLLAQGLGCRTERADLQGHESGQDHLAIYLHNGVEYLEVMLGCWKARVAPFNVNYRYVAEELQYLLLDAGATAIVVHSRFAPTLAEVLPDAAGAARDRPGPRRQRPRPAARRGLVRRRPGRRAGGGIRRPRSADDLYILYTGGTTGMPKGVLWRNGDAMIECFGGSPTARTLDDFLAETDAGMKALITPPFMHGAGHWVALRCGWAAAPSCCPSTPEHLDPADVWGLVERERIEFMLIVGDAFARPLLDELDRHSYDLSSLNVILSGGAALSVGAKQELLAHMPTVMIVDGLGSSEAGGQLSHVSTGSDAATGSFPPRPGNHILSADLDRVLTPGDDEVGWLAKSGRLALGYLGDAAKTARTYPVVDGVRYAIPGRPGAAGARTAASSCTAATP